MIVRLLVIGKTKEKWVDQGIQHYTKRIKPFVGLDIQYLKDQKVNTIESKKQADGEVLAKEIDAEDYVILLDEGGEELSSVQFADFFTHPATTSKRKLTFVIGGAYGFSETIYKRADKKISLSEMTFPHDLVRVMFLEQLYRAYTIINNKKYHHS